MVRSLLWICLLLVLAGCKSFPFGRIDPDERRSEVELALYATENANPNPNAPAEPIPAQPPIRIELSGNTLDDMAAQLATMAKLIEQERQAPGSIGSEPVGTVRGRSAVSDRATAPADELAKKEEAAEVAATGATPDKAPTGQVASALSGLPPTAVFEQHVSKSSSGDGAASPQALGTYRGEDVVEAAPGMVALQRGKPSPLAIQVVQLSDDSMLISADYDALALDLKKALGTTYLRHDDYVLKPGQYKTVPLRRLAKDTLYLGVIAAYHEPDLRRWKAVYRVEPAGRRYGVLMLFDDAGATIQSEQLR